MLEKEKRKRKRRRSDVRRNIKGSYVKGRQKEWTNKITFYILQSSQTVTAYRRGENQRWGGRKDEASKR